MIKLEKQDEFYMKKALQLAEEAAEKGEVPVGAIIVCKGQIIAKAYNQTEQLQDVTAHAEMIAITSAANYIGGKYLKACTLYVTLEPCLMCGAATNWAQLSRIVYGAADEERGSLRLKEKAIHPKCEVVGGVLAEESRELLQSFFQSKRKSNRPSQN